MKKLKPNQLKQLRRLFAKEYSLSFLERCLSLPFDFERSVMPVHPKNGLLSHFFSWLEDRYLIDLILVDSNHSKVSALNHSQSIIESTEVVQRLRQISTLKNEGRRIFFINHHEGYVGPYFLRSVLHRLGFENLGAQCNTIIGPRMRSNVILKTISSNAGNTFLVLPSSKTKPLKSKALEQALLGCSRTTQALMKLPDRALMQIETLSYENFMNSVVHASAMGADTQFADHAISTDNPALGLKDLSQKDFQLFKQIMREPFFVFPEGTRSRVDENGDITMRYINPRYLQTYMRPDDVILPVNLVGGSDALKNTRLRPATFGFSVGDLIYVDQNMIDNYREEGIKIMRKVASLPNIKTVHFSEEIQNRNL